MKSPSYPKKESDASGTDMGGAVPEKVDILLVQPPIQDFFLTAKRTVPYGLICMAAVLREAGFNVAILDGLANSKKRPLNLPEKMAYLSAFYAKPDIAPIALFHQYRHFGYSFEYIGKAARAVNARIVGISSLFTPYAFQALETAAAIKRYLPHCKIVMGGHHPTALPEEVISHADVDFVIRGEGEIALLQLARTLATDGDLKAVPGLVYRKSDGTLHISDPATLTDLAQLPLPAHDLLNHNYYRRSKYGALTIAASRGCPMACSYCSMGFGADQSYHRRSATQVLAEIDFATRVGPVDFIDFEDENLTLDKSFFLELLTGIRNRWKGKNIELRAMNGLFPPSLDADIITAMKVSGFKTLNLSLGATTAKQLSRFKRADVRAAFNQALKLARIQGLKSVAYIVAAAPYQNPLDSVQDLLYLAKRRILAGVSIFYPAPGSHDYDLCRSLKILPRQFCLMRSSALPISHTTSRTEAVTLLRLGRILNFMKALIDRGISLPAPALPKAHIDSHLDRLSLGIQLLAWFFKDAHIRGVLPNGEVYQHRIALSLTQAFNDQLKKVAIKGTC